MLLAGCDSVYGLEGRLPPEARPGDEDGDGVLDNNDSCPHIANESDTDLDDDGVSEDCDPDDKEPSTLTRWIPITAGSLEDAFVQTGAGKIVADGFELGVRDERSWLVFDLDAMAHTANIDVGYEMMSNVIEDSGTHPWSELGVHTVHRGMTDSTRGSVCFLGIGEDGEQPPVVAAYLETKEDEQTRSTVSFAPPLNGTLGRLYQFRTMNEVRCGARRGDEITTSNYEVTRTSAMGGFAISADRIVAKLTHVWIAWQPLDPPSP
jgi:hypothetical protein